MDRKAVEVFRYPADMTGAGPRPAFDVLAAVLPHIRARGCYGTYRARDGPPEYFACAERLPSDPDRYPDLESGTIPGGLYVRRVLIGDWRQMISEIPRNFQRLVQEFPVDRSRPSIEYYRGDHELELLVPVLDRRAISPDR